MADTDFQLDLGFVIISIEMKLHQNQNRWYQDVQQEAGNVTACLVFRNIQGWL